MANSNKQTTTKKPRNEYVGKSVPDLENAFLKLEDDYQLSLSKGKITSLQTAELRRERARILQALTDARINDEGK